MGSPATLLVLGDTIAQAAQFCDDGNASRPGRVAYSLVVSPELANRGTYALIAASEHEPLRQRMVLLKNAGSTAQHLYQYLQEPAARGVLRRFGFEGATIAAHGLGGARRFCSTGDWYRRASCPIQPLAWSSAGIRRFRGRLLVEALVTVPLVPSRRPFSVHLLVAFGARSVLGQTFHAVFGQSLAFLVPGLLLASLIAESAVCRAAHSAWIRSIPRRARDAAACCGLTPWQRFFSD